MSLQFDPIWPWPLIVVTVLGMLGVVAIAYPRRVRHLPGAWGKVLLGCRLGVILFLAMMMVRLALAVPVFATITLVLAGAWLGTVALLNVALRRKTAETHATL